MTKKEKAELRNAFEELDNLVCYHNKNLTYAQFETLSKIRDTLKTLGKEKTK